MKSIHDLLREHSFFSGISPADTELIAGCGINRHFKSGEYLAREGEPADHFYVVRKGLISVELYSPTHGSIPIQTMNPGEVVGFSWIFPPYRWSMDLLAKEETSLVQVDGACLRGKCEKDPRMGYDLMKRFARMMSDRLNASRVQLLDLYGNDKNSTTP